MRVQVPLRVPWGKINKINDKQCRETTYGWFFCAFNLYADRERELSSAIHSKKTQVAAFLPVQQLCATDPQELMAGKY
ncbi:hypothetical protein DPP00_21320 [Salmonella enterica subsp. enterica serovar Vom]|nr:hypothetical protein [Salmonella enterica subsp. enterica serovar Vom]